MLLPRPATDQIQTLAKRLVEAQRPIPIFGDEVWKSSAQKEVLELVELLGLPAAGPGLGQGYRNVPTRHPQYIGTYAGPATAYPRGSADLVIQVGARDWGGAERVASRGWREVRHDGDGHRHDGPHAGDGPRGGR